MNPVPVPLGTDEAHALMFMLGLSQRGLARALHCEPARVRYQLKRGYLSPQFSGKLRAMWQAAVDAQARTMNRESST